MNDDPAHTLEPWRTLNQLRDANKKIRETEHVNLDGGMDIRRENEQLRARIADLEARLAEKQKDLDKFVDIAYESMDGWDCQDRHIEDLRDALKGDSR